MIVTPGELRDRPQLRAAQPKRAYGAVLHAKSAVVALATTAALVNFFLSYLSVFAYPSAREVFTSAPEGAPGHREAELPVIAGLAGYLVTTLLLVAPLLFLRRRARLPHGTVTVLVAAVALPAAALTQLTFAMPAVAAVAGAALVDLLLAARPEARPVQVGQAGEAGLGVALPPADHRRPGHPDPAGNLRVRHTVGGEQHDPGARIANPASIVEDRRKEFSLSASPGRRTSGAATDIPHSHKPGP